MRAPRLVPYSLFLTLGVTACGKTGAVRPPAPPAAPAPATPAPPAPESAPGMSGETWASPPPVDVSAPSADAQRDPNGVARKILARGTGTTHAPANSYVDLRYQGWERNGKQFEGTPAAGQTGRFDMKDLPAGLAAELTTMVVGDKRRLWLPAALAYGKRVNFANAPRGDMTYEVELVRIIPLPPVPPDLKAPPKDAKTTKSGLTYLVLEKGTGKVHPTEETRANVVYSAWTPDGHMFQCSLITGDVAPVRVKRLPPGWREAMEHMVEGDKWRLWLPGKLAFGDLKPGEEALPFGPPPGPVVFDVALVKIIE